MGWRFVCPICGHVAKTADWKAAGAGEGSVAFACVGRWLDSARDAFGGTGPGPCNYTGGGLFALNPITVEVDAKKHTLFAFDEQRREGDPEPSAEPADQKEACDG